MIENLYILIPARCGSKRIKNKNLAEVGGIPLIGHTLTLAKQLVETTQIIVSTECREICETVNKFGIDVPFLRSPDISQDLSPDILWVQQCIKDYSLEKKTESIAILRPTNPFRTVATIKKAYATFLDNLEYDSLRAIRPVKEHPAKMWIKNGKEIVPLIDEISPITNTNMHSSPFQALPKYWIQDASLEITKVKVVIKTKTISGNKVLGFEMPGIEGFDINYPEDLIMANKIFEAIDNEKK